MLARSSPAMRLLACFYGPQGATNSGNLRSQRVRRLPRYVSGAAEQPVLRLL
jgi:hypothetical protein